MGRTGQVGIWVMDGRNMDHIGARVYYMAPIGYIYIPESAQAPEIGNVSPGEGFARRPSRRKSVYSHRGAAKEKTPRRRSRC